MLASSAREPTPETSNQTRSGVN
uniref:Uncharacterized protein n=1 Tax=Rhizophora mucronata TaxID=61149 RepID=A0A2P2M4L5_RHIMU